MPYQLGALAIGRRNNGRGHHGGGRAALLTAVQLMERAANGVNSNFLVVTTDTNTLQVSWWMVAAPLDKPILTKVSIGSPRSLQDNKMATTLPKDISKIGQEVKLFGKWDTQE